MCAFFLQNIPSLLRSRAPYENCFSQGLLSIGSRSRTIRSRDSVGFSGSASQRVSELAKIRAKASAINQSFRPSDFAPAFGRAVAALRRLAYGTAEPAPSSKADRAFHPGFRSVTPSCDQTA